MDVFCDCFEVDCGALEEHPVGVSRDLCRQVCVDEGDEGDEDEEWWYVEAVWHHLEEEMAREVVYVVWVECLCVIVEELQFEFVWEAIDACDFLCEYGGDWDCAEEGCGECKNWEERCEGPCDFSVDFWGE